MREVQIVKLLECDPGLGDGLTEEEREAASVVLQAPAVSLGKGPWQPSSQLAAPDRFGYLVAAGLLVRRVEVDQGSSVELLGSGDLLRPWQEDASSFCAASWEVLEDAALVPLGGHVAHSIAAWPAVVSNLMARGVRRSRALAADAAIASIVGVEERILLLLWRIAETWGEVGDDGVHLSIRLPHRLLAELVGARRPSVTTALKELQGSGRLAGTSDGCWVLLGDPPR